jgi:protease-4
VRVRDLDAGWAALEELRRELRAFREGGGRVVAYLADGVDTRSYYLACAADEILATPLATLNVTGARVRVNFFKDVMNRLGLQAEVVAVSPYKTAGDPFVRDDFSRESREQIERLLDRRYEELTRAICEGRDLSPELARAAIDCAPFGARDALAEGLLDGVCYEDELPQRLGSDGRRVRLSEWNAARRTLRAPYRRRLRRRVGLVKVSGSIVRGKSKKLPVPLPFLGGEQAGSESVVAALRVAEKDRRVAAVLLHVESPGGDALASDLIWREVERIRAKKPVVVLMGNVAASGGYYVSAPANHIVARRNTVTGSIGVLMVRPVADGLYRKIGINPRLRGARSARRVPRPEQPSDRRRVAGTGAPDPARLRRVQGPRRPRPEDRAYGSRRHRRRARLDREEAREIGLVDEIGGFREALRKAAELGGIRRDGPGMLVKISGPRTGRPTPGNPVEAARDAMGEMGRTLSEFRPDRVWALTPFEISED